MKIIMAEHGSQQRNVDVKKIVVADLWHIAMRLKGDEQKIVLTVWHLAHDMHGALCAIANGADIKKPIHTK